MAFPVQPSPTASCHSAASVRPVAIPRTPQPAAVPGHRQSPPSPAGHNTLITGLKILSLAVCLLSLGCVRESGVSEIPAIDLTTAEGAINVPANRAWTSSNVSVQAGDVLTIVATGAVSYADSAPDHAGPEGTYLFSNDVLDQQFPIPSGASGPAPCYGLIGRIGDSEPFFIGRKKSWTVQHTGRLHLGINDFNVADNIGQFEVRIHKPQTVQPVRFERTLPPTQQPGHPVAGARVVVIYVDGLRPDVVREMAAMGQLPRIQEQFLDGGTWFSRSFTAFPSDTITSNGTMWTGCFSDRHGLKGQVRFNRRSLYSESYLEPLGPHRSSKLLAPKGIDAAISSSVSTTLRWTRGKDVSQKWRETRHTGIPPLYERLRENGQTWATGVLPMMTEVPPLLWTRSLVKQMPYLRSHQAWKYIDDANTHYAIQHLLDQQRPITIIWMPETDSVSHKQRRGQFGVTRRTIAQADRLIGMLVDELRATRQLSKTYLMLVSDHGHHGGRKTHLAHFDLANEVFFKPREVSPQGAWLGGGFGMSVRQHRQWNKHAGDGSREFVFIDGNADGTAQIFLPREHYRSGLWMGPERPGNLLSYRISDDQPPINLLNSLATSKSVHSDGSVRYPVDLVLMRVDADTILITTADRGSAVIHRKRNAQDRWVYRYTPVSGVRPATHGGVTWRVILLPQLDPLGIMKHHPVSVLNDYHDETTWLQMTMSTPYPDSVVSLTRHLLWQENLAHREPVYAPDLVVTARPGWYFGGESTPGTTHGYPFFESMRASWFVAGPNIHRGARIDTPCRLVDLAPTILDMVGLSSDDDNFDGRALTTLYQSSAAIESVAAHPVYWQDVDLDGWSSLQYEPLPEYESKPYTVNRPDSPWDANNLAYNLVTLGELNLLRVLDDVAFPLTRERGVVIKSVQNFDRMLRHVPSPWVSEAVSALNVPGLAISDHAMTSTGNLKRLNGIVEWIQSRLEEGDDLIAHSIGREDLPMTATARTAVDGFQSGFWEVYSFGQRLLMSVLDEKIVNGLENRIDATVNAYGKLPASTTVDENNKAGVARLYDD